MKRTILIALVFLAAYARPSFAQNAVISGVVTKSPSGEPAAGALPPGQAWRFARAAIRRCREAGRCQCGSASSLS